MALTPLAGALGAWFDERTHWGLLTWMSLCRARSPGFLTALRLQVTLMPTAASAMLGAALLGTLAVAMQRSRAAPARMMLSAHLGCVIATIVAAGWCPVLLRRVGTGGLAVAGMLGIDLLVTAAAAALLLFLIELPMRQRLGPPAAS